uniref:Cadherin domain-containing protein n=1 Tax=Macrostomum lignano TaxID=282301 RepID=A0A1I8FNQ8_9PLAT
HQRRPPGAAVCRHPRRRAGRHSVAANLTALSGSPLVEVLAAQLAHGRASFPPGRPRRPRRRSLPLVRHEVARRLQCSGCSGDEDDSAVAAAAASDSDGSGGDSEDWPTCQCPVLLAGRCQPAADSAGPPAARGTTTAPEFVGVGVVGATAGAAGQRGDGVNQRAGEVNGSAVAGLPVAAVEPGTRPGSACDSFGCSRWTSTTPRRRRCSSAGAPPPAHGGGGRRRQRLSLRLLRAAGRRGRRDSYRLPAHRAADAGEPPLTGSLSLTVLVLDENDNRPAWLPDVVWSVNVSELAPDGTTVTQLRAADPDAGANGRVDRGSGEVRLRRGARLDYERVKAYRVPVRARDRGPAPRHTEGEVAVRLLDENDEAPSITVHSLGEHQRPEGGPPRPRSAPMTAQCRRISRWPGRLLPAGRGQGLRSQCRRDLQPAVAYQLVTTRPLDRESLRGGAVAATVSCADGGSSPRRTVLRLRVAVLDENDNPPNFTRRYSRCSWTRSSNPGPLLAGSKAVDVDEWPALNYSLLAGSDPDAEVVSVDSDSGLVRSQVRFDRETRDRYQFQRRSSRSATALVELTIADVNDTRREWVGGSSQQLLRVAGELPANTPGLRGQWPRWPTAWSGTARPGSSASGRDGEVYVVAGGGAWSWTASGTPTLSLKVIAFDFGRPRLGARTSARLTVALIDENDSSPRLLFPSFADNRIAVSCRLPVGGWATTPGCRSASAKGPWREHFSVDASSGNLTLAKPLTCATSPERISLRVSAKDHGRPPRFTAAGAVHRPRGAADAVGAAQPPQEPQAPGGRPGWRAGGGSDGSGRPKRRGWRHGRRRALGRGPGPGGGALPHWPPRCCWPHPRLRALARSSAVTDGVSVLYAAADTNLQTPVRAGLTGSSVGRAAGISVKRRNQNSLSAKDISLPQAPSDSVAAAAAAAETEPAD